MKKRILAMLLLVVMIVTALPLTLIPSLATEEKDPEFKEEDYNALYAAQDAAVISLDFFNTNEWWGETVPDVTLPYETKNYTYAGKTYDFTDPKNRLIQPEECYAVLRSDNVFVYQNKDGGWGTASMAYPSTKGVTDDFTQNMPRQTFTYAEAEAVVKTVEKYWADHTYKIVKVSLWMIWRDNAGTLEYYTGSKWNSSSTKVVAVYETEADAQKVIAELLGEGVSPDENGVYVKDGVKYYAAVRPLPTVEYYQCVQDYGEKVRDTYVHSADISDNRVVNFGQMMPTIGEVNYHSRDGVNGMYTHLVFEDGYMRINPHHSGAYSSISSIPQTGTIYFDAIMTGGSTNTEASIFSIRGAKFNFKITSTGTKFLQLVNHSYWNKETLPNVKATADYLVEGRNTPFHLTVLSTVSDAGDKITFNTKINGVEVLDNTALSFDGSGDGLVAHSQSSTARFYTYRIYNRALTPAEQAQNHFADLMKWFKMDLTPLAYVNEKDMPAIYAAVSDYTITSDRDAVYNAMLRAALLAAEGKYAGISPDYLAFAVRYGLDVSYLEKLPRSYLPTTYAYLDGLTAASENVKAGYDAAIAADFSMLWAKSTLSYTDYNDLYVKDGMTTALDYFATNSIWGQKAVAANSPDYVWKWSRLNSDGSYYIALKANAGTIANGFLRLNQDTQLGGTDIANNYSQDGMTTEFVFADDRPGGGTFLNIDDIRFATRTDDTKYNLYAVGQRAFYEVNFYRLNEKSTATANNITSETYKSFVPTLSIMHKAGARTYVVQADAPNYTQNYYNYFYKSVKDAYAGENKEYVLPTDTQLKPYGTTAANLLANGHTYFYITHDENGNALAADKVSRIQFAFQKPVYTEKTVTRTVIDGDETKEVQVTEVYITGYTHRFANYGKGLGENGKDYFHTETGSLALMVDGETLFSQDGLIYADNSGISGGSYLLYSLKNVNSTYVNRDVYAYRAYKRILSDGELAQNHFVDVAKYYKLNLAGLENLEAAGKAAVYATVADIRIGEVDRMDVQFIVTSAIYAENQKLYASLKGENATVNAFIDFAAEYYIRLDTLNAILKSDRDMSSVYATAFTGNREEMQGKVYDAYLDAYYFLSYQVKGDDEWNAWLSAVAAADKLSDIENLMILPQNVRRGIVKINANDADAVAAYISDMLVRYETAPDYDYNSLYQREGLLFAFDIMKTNAIWNEALPALPVPPNELTAYEYDMNADGEIDPKTEVFDFSDPMQRFDEGKYVIKKMRYKDGKNDATYIFVDTVKLPDGTSRANTIVRFDTEKEAQDYITAETKSGKLVTSDKNYTYTYSVLKPYVVTYASNDATSVTGHSGYQIFYDRHYDTLEEGEALSSNKDYGTRDYQIVPNAYNYAYYSAVDAYYKKINEWLDANTWSISELSRNMKIATSNPLTNGNGFSQIRDFELARACFETPENGKGYLTQIFSHATDNGLTFSLPSEAAYIKNDNVSAQLVTKTGTGIKNAFILFYNVRPTIDLAKDGGSFSFSGFNSNSRFATSKTATVDKDISTSDVLTMTVSLKGATTANATDTFDTFAVRTGTTTVYEIAGLYGSGAAGNLNTTNQIGYANSYGGGEIYALRYYNHDLSEAEILQNNFADLAKWYRLDIEGYDDLAPEMKVQLHRAFAKYTVNGEADRADLTALYNILINDNYDAVADKLSAEMLAIVRELGLDVSALVAADDAVRAYAEALVLAEFRAGDTMSRAVVQTMINEALVYKAAFAYEGIQVRLQSKASVADMPGVRAIFTANKSVLDAYAEISKDFAFGVEICDVNGKALAILRFAPDGEGNYSGTNTLASGVSAGKAIITPVGENSLAFAYTVIFDTAETQTAAYYNVEFSYRFFFEVNGLRHNAEVMTSDTFGDTVSAAEAYRYFYANGFADDGVVAGVMKELNGDDFTDGNN